MQQPQQLCRQQTKAAAKAAGAAAAAAAAASAHLQAASAASTPHSTPASRPSSAAAPPLALKSSQVRGRRRRPSASAAFFQVACPARAAPSDTPRGTARCAASCPPPPHGVRPVPSARAPLARRSQVGRSRSLVLRRATVNHQKKILSTWRPSRRSRCATRNFLRRASRTPPRAWPTCGITCGGLWATARAPHERSSAARARSSAAAQHVAALALLGAAAAMARPPAACWAASRSRSGNVRSVLFYYKGTLR